MLQHAHAEVPYYREIIDAVGMVGSDGLVNLERFQDLPLLSKEVLRRRSDELCSDDLGRRDWHYNTSGGSTGEPVRFIQDATYKDWGAAATAFFDSWTGYTAGQRRVVLWGSERDLFASGEPWNVRLGRFIRNEQWLNTFRMGRDRMTTYVDRINQFRPVQILAYAESIYELARFVEREGLSVWSPQAVMTSAGTLHPYMRETVQRVFQAPVFNRYGSREVGNVAGECDSHGGLHVVTPSCFVEVVKPDGSPVECGEVGEVAVTLLTNFSMPLIRYRIGDMASWATDPCPCGRSFPTLRHVTGRMSDTFATLSGELVHGEYFTHLLYFRPWVERFQVVQESALHVRVRVVLAPGAKPPEIETSEIERKIRVALGDECMISWEFPSEIRPSNSGKFRYTLSNYSRPE